MAGGIRVAPPATTSLPVLCHPVRRRLPQVMYDQSKAYWFLQYTDGNGHKNGDVYNEPGGPGDQVCARPTQTLLSRPMKGARSAYHA
jgi:hypothetical protein